MTVLVLIELHIKQYANKKIIPMLISETVQLSPVCFCIYERDEIVFIPDCYSVAIWRPAHINVLSCSKKIFEFQIKYNTYRRVQNIFKNLTTLSWMLCFIV